MPHVKSLSNMLSCIGVNPSDFVEQNTNLNSFESLSLDSRNCNQQTIFVAIYGLQTCGHLFLESAASLGCRLALVETKEASKNGQVEQIKYSTESSIICISVFELNQKLADIAYSFYQAKNQSANFNSLPNVTAITGTNGKTSVASLIAQLSSLCGHKSASIGTLGVNEFDSGLSSKLANTLNTTPDIISLISTLSFLEKQGCKHVALEASSHGLEQNRLHKLRVNCAVFTNLTQDHLDYHKTMEDYAEAKRKLLSVTGLSNVILNADDIESQNWLFATSMDQNVFWYSLSQLSIDKMGCWASDIEYSTDGIEFNLHAKFAEYTSSEVVNVQLIGAFNVANILASITALLAQGFSFSELTKAIGQLKSVPGRMELFETNKASFLVDYAHTPDALQQALLAARVHTKGKLSCIFGCGGDRDTGKRAMMGEVASRHSDLIVLTQDNSRSEEPLNIIADIKSGIPLQLSSQIAVELDREKAINHAWQNSHKSDMILVAGKGAEDYIEINGKRIPYNERQIVADLASRSLVLNDIIHTKGGEQ